MCLAFELLSQQTWTTRRLVNEKKKPVIQTIHFLFLFCGCHLILVLSRRVKCIQIHTTQTNKRGKKEDKIVPHQDGRLTAPYGVLKSFDWTMQRNERRLDALRNLIGWKNVNHTKIPRWRFVENVAVEVLSGLGLDDL